MAGANRMSRESLFCYYCATLGNPREAAIRAGYPVLKAEEQAAKLLAQKQIRALLGRYARRKQQQHAESLALQGLARMAFGEINDAVRLMTDEEFPSAEELMKLNLFSVAEIKRPKGGGLEIKFFDRLRPLELLLGYSEKQPSSNAASFYRALTEDARQTPSLPEDGDSHAL